MLEKYEESGILIKTKAKIHYARIKTSVDYIAVLGLCIKVQLNFK